MFRSMLLAATATVATGIRVTPTAAADPDPYPPDPSTRYTRSVSYDAMILAGRNPDAAPPPTHVVLPRNYSDGD